jgi:hypothetical protein
MKKILIIILMIGMSIIISGNKFILDNNHLPEYQKIVNFITNNYRGISLDSEVLEYYYEKDNCQLSLKTELRSKKIISIKIINYYYLEDLGLDGKIVSLKEMIIISNKDPIEDATVIIKKILKKVEEDLKIQ